MDSPPVGSLAVPAPRFRESLGLGEGAGILMALRRGSAHLYYPDQDRGYWIPTHSIQAIPAEAVPPDSLERFLHDLLTFLAAEETILESREGATLSLSVETAGTSRAHLAELAARLGERLVDFRVVPGSMRAIVFQLDLAALPDAAGTGT